MAAWRIHLSDQTVRWLDILPGKPSVIAAWTQANRVAYFDLSNGARHGERTFDGVNAANRKEDAWRGFIAGLTAPNDAILPLVRLPNATIQTTADGRMVLVQMGANDLYLTVDGKESRLQTDAKITFAAVSLDRSLGLVAALDTTGRLHTYQQSIRVGVFDVGLAVSDEFRPALAISYGGTSIFVTDGQQIMLR
jgi:hypothetical protein